MSDQSNPFPDEFGQRLFQQTLDLWINPEIDRRKKENRLPADFNLKMAQIVMNVGQPLQVRLNGEIRGIMEVRINKPINKGDRVCEDDYSEIASFELTDQDPNAAYLLLINHRGSWFIYFDFKYNAQRIHEHLQAAKEFLDTAENCLEQKKYRSFHENLFAAVELCSKSWLLSMPIPKLLESTKHKFIRSQINIHSKLGNMHVQHAKVLNHLLEMRSTARYVQVGFSPVHGDCSNLLKKAKDLFVFVEKSSPKRRLSGPR